MIFLLIALGIIAAVATSGTVLFPLGLAVAVVSFWANGVIANYKGEFSAPPKAARAAGMACLVLSIVLIPVGFALK